MNNSCDQNSTTPVPEAGRDMTASEEILSYIVPWIALICVIIAVTLNGLCLVAFCREACLRTVFNCYLINLTIVDFLYAAFSGTLFVVQSSTDFVINPEFCHFILWLDWALSAVGQLTVVLIAIDRVWATCRPFSYTQWQSYRLTLGKIAVIWLLVLAYITPRVIIESVRQVEKHFCGMALDARWMKVWALCGHFFYFIGPQIGVMFCCFLIAVKTKQQEQVIAESRSRSSSEAAPLENGSKRHSKSVSVSVRQRMEKDRRLFRMLVLLVVFMVICWMPSDIFLCLYITDVIKFDYATAVFTSLLMYAGCIANPIVYQTGSEDMRRVLKNLMSCR